MSEDYISHIKVGENGEEYSLRDLLAIYREEMLNAVFPVGSIHMSTTMSTAEQVAAAFGGTWEAWGQGRVPVGVGLSDKSFTAGETGGASQAPVPAHTHNAVFSGTPVSGHTHALSESAGGSARVTTPALYSRYHDFVHTPASASAYRGTINGSTSAPYYYLRRSADAMGGAESGSGGSGGSVIRSSTGISQVYIPGGERCTVSGSTSDAGGHTPSGTVSVESTGSDALTTNLQPYVTCYMWKRIA